MDWNEDGKKDLLTGGRDGFIRIYLNINTDADPVFSNYTNVQAGGATFDAGYTAMPDVVDWNRDGRKDLIVGEDTGKIWLLINTGTNAAPVFANADYMKDGTVALDVGTKAAPVAVDWDGDGLLDLVVGEYTGNIVYYRNLTLGIVPDFAPGVKLEAGGATIDVEYYSRLDVVDWDNDGILDILSGNRNYNAAPSGGIWYFRGVGPLSADGATISSSSGGTINFSLDAGAAHAYRQYFLVGNFTGTTPGMPLPGGGVLPLNYDAVLDFVRYNYGLPMFTDFKATLDANGMSTATLSAAALPLPAGLTLNFAFTTMAPFDFQSNPVPVEILP